MAITQVHPLEETDRFPEDFMFSLYMQLRMTPFFSQRFTYVPTGETLEAAPLPPPSPSQRTYLVQDVPAYLKVALSDMAQPWACRRVHQYKGFAADLQKYTDIQGFLNAQLSRRNRKNLRAKLNKLEGAHAITYAFYFGAMEKETYDSLFDAFYDLLLARFDVKKLYNRNLLHWNRYYRLAYAKILRKEASLFVIYDQGKPIALTLNFHFKDLVFSFIETFDIAYTDYNMGDICMLKMLEWSLAHKVRLFDLSKGESYYKQKWCNYHYGMDYYLFYRPESPAARLWAWITQNKLLLKTYLRERGIIGKWFQYDKFFYNKQRKQLEGYDWKKD